MIRTGKDIKGITYHCSAGYGDLASMRRFWRSLGWKTDGYHLLVGLDGSITQVVPFNLPSNGVAGHNANYINICYTGGVERSNTSKAMDSRTPAQKLGLIEAGYMALEWIKQTGGDPSKITVKGHRDFSPDKNGDGVISSWERIKECPSFDAIPEYKDLVKNFLTLKGISVGSSIEYVVRSGDNLTKIARMHGVTVAEISELNNLKTPMIDIGQRLKIKDPKQCKQ